MKLIEPGLHHYLWAEFLLRRKKASSVLDLTRKLGVLRYRLMRRETREDLELCYANLLTRARDAGYPIEGSPCELARKHVVLRPLLGIAPALIAFGKEAVVGELIDSSGFARILEAHRRGKGVVLLSTHFGATGCVTALAHRHGLPTLVIRDSQFRRYEGTLHGRHYYLGAETLFPDHSDAASADRVLLRCARALKSGQIISYVCDAGHGRFTTPAQVLGAEAPWRMALVALAGKTGSPVIPVFLPFRENRIYLLMHDVYSIRDDQDLTDFAYHFSREYERVVSAYPENLSWNTFERRVLAGR